MDKFYIIENENFLDELTRANEMYKARDIVIREFMNTHKISGRYHLSGDGSCNRAFDVKNRDNIHFYVDDIQSNVRFSKQHKDYKGKLLSLKKLTLEKPKNVFIKDSRLKFLNDFLQMQVDYLLTL